MAMPTNFWRNEQMLNIFRTKPCQRLARDGVCRWRSQCQYSHCPEWPRRQPRKYAYSPEVCPHLHSASGCRAGLSCPQAHSKEEVLFHPHFFKTHLCKEHASNAVQRGSRSARIGKRHRCHRYYCPFAHGSEELQSSPLTEEQRERCLQSIEMFPADDCCLACTRYWLMPYQRTEERIGTVLDLEAHLPIAPWPHPSQATPAPPPPSPWGQLQTGPGRPPTPQRERWPQDAREAKAGPRYSFSSAYKPLPVTNCPAPLQDKASSPWSAMMPAFIDVDNAGDFGADANNSPEQQRTSSVSRQRELLGEVVYAML